MENECPICLSSIDIEKLFVTKCCNKQFHIECFEECMKYKAECPLCRHSDHVIIIIEEQERELIIVRYNKIIYTLISIVFSITVFRYFVNI
jgi:hypothetical protein